VEFHNSQDVVVSNLQSSGEIVFNHTRATLVDVVNEGAVTVKAEEVTIYGVVNSGTILVKKGAKVYGHLQCNAGGTITIEEGGEWSKEREGERNF